jgi:hypothetical protein
MDKNGAFFFTEIINPFSNKNHTNGADKLLQWHGRETDEVKEVTRHPTQVFRAAETAMVHALANAFRLSPADQLGKQYQ